MWHTCLIYIPGITAVSLSGMLIQHVFTGWLYLQAERGEGHFSPECPYISNPFFLFYTILHN
jgi:hypothetical protein